MRYMGMGFYVGEWHRCGEGLCRVTFDLMYGPDKQFAATPNPDHFVGTYSDYIQIKEGKPQPCDLRI